MNSNLFATITKKASKTFYTTTLLFPKDVRNDVFILYSFLRKADDYIDANPPQLKEYKNYKKMTYNRLAGKPVTDIIVNTFGELVHRKKIDHKLVTDFFTSLEIDLKQNNYESFDDLKRFTYGVAEVVGLLMASVMNLPKKSFESAKKLGLAMQLVNILRDIEEDRQLGRVYIPQNELLDHKLPSILTIEHVLKYPNEFKLLMSFQINRIINLFEEAKLGFKHLPKEYLLPISSAADIYFQTAKLIEKDPLIIFKKKVKLSKMQMSYILFKNLMKKNAAN